RFIFTKLHSTVDHDSYSNTLICQNGQWTFISSVLYLSLYVGGDVPAQMSALPGFPETNLVQMLVKLNILF
uniref:Uncharacterized protein n=1 Tax=Takifugu rubripes TaxID=31033 RepID=A0A674N3E5_TAKRU